MRASPPRFSFAALAAGLAILPLPVLAQTQDPHAGEGRHESAPFEEIVITADPLGRSRFEVLQGTSVVEREALERQLDATIGDTLDDLPGLSQTAFGQGASRPVIRGLSGDRLRVLVNSLGTFDVSTTSPDHAVALDVATAKRIEVVRGPATLIYGNNAIAGVVNQIDDRVPRAVPEGFADGFLRGLYGSNADETLVSGRVNAGLGGGLVANVNGSWRETDNFEAPGFLRSDALRAAEPLEPGEDEPFGVADNSDQENWSAGGGLSYAGDFGFLGASVTGLDNNYGIPIELEEEEEAEAPGLPGEGAPAQEEGGVRIDIEQIRVDLIGNLDTDFLVFDETRVRFGWADYEQAELESAEVGTVFENKAWEGRIDFIQAPLLDGLTGSTGVQLRDRDFSAVGAEAFVPPNDLFQWGLYTYQSYETGSWRFNGGARVDRQSNESPVLGVERDFTSASVSGGVSYTLADSFLVGASGFRVERAPTAEELFSNGPHLATFTFELGDPDLGEETATGAEATIKKTGGALTYGLNAFYYSYDDFIFEDFTGAEEDGLPVAVFTATDAEFYGLEFEAGIEAWRSDDGDQAVLLDLVIDIVEAEERNGRPLPRIPPMSIQAAAEYRSRWFDLRFAAEFADEQSETAAFELPTDGYTDLTATLTVHPLPERDLSLIVQGRNLADETIRFHTSFLKDLVPAPGRDVRISLRAGF